MTRERSLGVALAATLALGACRGPDEISLGGTEASSTGSFLSPAGVDDALYGTRERPWKTFAFALGKLAPGSTLTLLDGTYAASTTGTLNVRCAAATPGSPAPNAVLASNGITITADHERAAFLSGDGSVPPVSVDGCQDWTIRGLRVEAQDLKEPEPPGVNDTGSVVVLDGLNQNVRLERLLARHPNRYKLADVIHVADGSTAVTIQESELYDFHHNAFEATRSSSIFFLRNYVSSRGTPDAAGADFAPLDAARGDYGVLLEETSGVVVANNVVEDVSIGYAIVGRAANVKAPQAADPLDGNHFLGNIAFMAATIGFRLDSQCASAKSCDQVHTIRSTDIGNDVVIGGPTGGAMGISDAGSVGTRIHEVSIINTARGVDLSKEIQNAALAAVSEAHNTLVVGFQSVAFFAAGQMGWSFDHCNATGGYDPASYFEPDDPAHVTSKVTLPPTLGTCLVYLPKESPLKNAGAGNDVGASIIFQYDATGQETTTALWAPTFPCGATVTGVNDDAATNCLGLNLPTRLNVGTPLPNGCPLP